MKLIRNFSIIAHIDHGKTTLTDRLLLKTGTIGARTFHERMLDSNPIEQERGVTIKLAPVRMEYRMPENLQKRYQSHTAILNLIDTPGHVDFGYEVSRSLAAGEGAVLLIDASQGVQAQTLANFDKAREQNLTIIPVLNKIDLPNVDLDRSLLELMELFGVRETDVLAVSAKTGEGVDDLLHTLVTRLPSPIRHPEAPLTGLVFSSLYDTHRGVVIYVRVMEGTLRAENLWLMGSGAGFKAQEVGVFSPAMTPIDQLEAGEVGYIVTGMKDIHLARVGDTVTTAPVVSTLIPLPGYRAPQLMVFMDFYPVNGEEFTELKVAMEKLQLNDAVLSFSPTHSAALGNGLRVGFLGIFHAEIVQERLEREFNLSLIATSPSVRYEVTQTDGTTIEVLSPMDLPDPSVIAEIREPVAEVMIFTPQTYLGAILQLCEDQRGKQQNLHFYGERVQITYRIPLPKLILTFHDELKSVSAGFASMEYQVVGYEPVKAVKLTILINKEIVEPLSQIVVADDAVSTGKQMVAKLKEAIPRQLFEIPIQAAVGGSIVARETIKAFRKDVTAKLYGGDRTRRMKLLEKQKKGKERRAQFGKVEIPQSAFMAVLKKS